MLSDDNSEADPAEGEYTGSPDCDGSFPGVNSADDETAASQPWSAAALVKSARSATEPRGKRFMLSSLEISNQQA